MTREELDTLWDKSVNESIKAGDGLARYRYAEYVAEAEREACAKVCEAEYEGYDWADREKDATEDCARAIRARGSK
jgi:hypothetical protein